MEAAGVRATALYTTTAALDGLRLLRGRAGGADLGRRAVASRPRQAKPSFDLLPENCDPVGVRSQSVVADAPDICSLGEALRIDQHGFTVEACGHTDRRYHFLQPDRAALH